MNLPRTLEPAFDASVAAAPQRPSLLLVDDDRAILTALKVALRGSYEIAATTDGFEAIEWMQSRSFDVIISDQKMPAISGIEVLRRARERMPRCVRLLLTGYAESEAVLDAINEVEVHRYLCKPWDNDHIRQVVRDAAHTAGRLRATAPEPPAGHGVAQILPFPLLHRAPAPAAAAPQDGAGRQETVLVIDPDDALAPLLRAELAGRAQVEHAASPDSVLRALAARHVGVVVFSFDVQSEADLGFLQLLKRERPFLLVIAVCGSVDTVRLIELINQAKIFRFMRRPAAPRVLAHHVASAIRLVSETRRDPRWLQLQQPEVPAAAAAGPQDGAARPVPPAVQAGLWSRVATWLRAG